MAYNMIFTGAAFAYNVAKPMWPLVWEFPRAVRMAPAATEVYNTAFNKELSTYEKTKIIGKNTLSFSSDLVAAGLGVSGVKKVYQYTVKGVAAVLDLERALKKDLNKEAHIKKESYWWVGTFKATFYRALDLTGVQLGIENPWIRALLTVNTLINTPNTQKELLQSHSNMLKDYKFTHPAMKSYIKMLDYIVSEIDNIIQADNSLPEPAEARRRREERDEIFFQALKRAAIILDRLENNEVPESMRDNKIMMSLVGPITDRFFINPVVVIRENGEETGIFYEREAIENWIQEHPGQTPPKWPEDCLPCSPQKLRESPCKKKVCHHEIDFFTRLKKDTIKSIFLICPQVIEHNSFFEVLEIPSIENIFTQINSANRNRT